jgi:hypothetical protein
MREDLVLATTASKLVRKGATTGTLNLSVLSYLNILAKRIAYVETLDMTESNAEKLRTLKDRFADVMNRCKDVCTYRVALNILNASQETINSMNNHPPTVADVEKIYSGDSYNFVYSDFTREFNDIDLGDRPKFVRIVTLPTTGVIKYLGAAIPAGFVFDLVDITDVTYELNGGSEEETQFIFQTSDNNQNVLFSNEAVFKFDLSEKTNNMPPTIGDNTITVDKNVTTVLTLEMFTSQTTAPYNDPENDLVDAIRIDRLHSTNKGTFYLNGTPVTEGLIINREQLENNEFTHIGTDEEDIHADGFEFSVRDEGSGIWVQ